MGSDSAYGEPFFEIKKENKMKIVVLGNTGMLGRYVYTYFKHNDYETIGVSRKDIDISEVNRNQLKTFFDGLELGGDDVVINCMGVIKPRVDELGVLNAININSVLPHVLEEILTDMDVKLIHPTTDCVFDGLKGGYDEDSPHDVTDVYGRT
jgi:dTDP-4-dehydrorhamnose reductase